MRIVGFNGAVFVLLIFQACSILALWYRIEGRSFVYVHNTDTQQRTCTEALSGQLVAINDGIRAFGNIVQSNAQQEINFDELTGVMTEALKWEAKKFGIQQCGSMQEQISESEDIYEQIEEPHIEAAASRILKDAVNAGVRTQEHSQALRDAGISQLAPSGRRKLLQQFAQAINSQRLRIEDPSSFFDVY